MRSMSFCVSLLALTHFPDADFAQKPNKKSSPGYSLMVVEVGSTSSAPVLALQILYVPVLLLLLKTIIYGLAKYAGGKADYNFTLWQKCEKTLYNTG